VYAGFVLLSAAHSAGWAVLVDGAAIFVEGNAVGFAATLRSVGAGPGRRWAWAGVFFCAHVDVFDSSCSCLEAYALIFVNCQTHKVQERKNKALGGLHCRSGYK
jgi:hypothetical protein